MLCTRAVDVPGHNRWSVYRVPTQIREEPHGRCYRCIRNNREDRALVAAGRHRDYIALQSCQFPESVELSHCRPTTHAAEGHAVRAFGRSEVFGSTFLPTQQLFV